MRDGDAPQAVFTDDVTETGSPMRRRFPLLAALSLSAILAGPASAACLPPTSAVFSGFGDANLYFRAPGGSFEKTTSWKLTGGAATVAGNETFFVGGAKESRALSLPAGSTATSPPFCVDPSAPYMRMFVRNTGSATSRLALDVVYTSPTLVVTATVARLSGTGSWAPTPATPYYANFFAALAPTGTLDISFRLRPLDTLGGWTVDDIYVDPYRRR